MVYGILQRSAGAGVAVLTFNGQKVSGKKKEGAEIRSLSIT
jgi:hypothetical protein